MITVSSTDGVQLAVHELGAPAPHAEPLLLCHATGLHGRVWGPFAGELPHRRCLAPDFRGYGDSTEQTTGSLDWYGFADDVLAVVDHFGLQGVQAVGHSKGGAALLLAEQARPGTFDRLVCFEPIVFPPVLPDGPEGGPGGAPERSNPLAEITRRRRETFPSREEAIERFAAKPPFDALRPDVLEAYVHHGFADQPDGSIRLKAHRDHEARTYEMGPHHAGFEHLGQVRCPVLVAHGGDGDGPAQIAPLVAEALPHGSLRPFPGLGHFGPLEDPEAVADVVQEFLDH